jgi:hypothetical protein
MKVFVHLFFAFMAILPVALMAQNHVGTWKMSVPDEYGTMTLLEMNISEDGTYTIDFGADGIIETKGKYQLNNEKMIIQDTEGSGCTEAGEYLIVIDGDIMTMTRMYDPCPDRGGTEGVMTMQRD